MKKYIDFDGVIKDTTPALFDDFPGYSTGTYISNTEHVIKKDWIYVLANSEVIGNAVEIVNGLNDAYILTRIHSLENEGVAKISDIRELGFRCDIILVPYQVKKTDIVSAKGNILVDDAIFNLDEWQLAGGIPIFFDLYGNNMDGWKVKNTKYTRTRTLEILRKYN